MLDGGGGLYTLYKDGDEQKYKKSEAVADGWLQFWTQHLSFKDLTSR